MNLEIGGAQALLLLGSNEPERDSTKDKQSKRPNGTEEISDDNKSDTTSKRNHNKHESLEGKDDKVESFTEGETSPEGKLIDGLVDGKVSDGKLTKLPLNDNNTNNENGPYIPNVNENGSYDQLPSNDQLSSNDKSTLNDLQESFTDDIVEKRTRSGDLSESTDEGFLGRAKTENQRSRIQRADSEADGRGHEGGEKIAHEKIDGGHEGDHQRIHQDRVDERIHRIDEINDRVDERIPTRTSPDHVHPDQSVVDAVDFYDENQQLNDAVEAAVMRYVGGSLDHKRKRKMDDYDFNQWTGFLEVEDEYDYNPKRKKRSENNEIDPELAGLSAEHDQLVEAAILDARELARQINSDIDGEMASGVTPQQAQQVLAAANAAVQQGQAEESLLAITQLAQAASSLSEEPKKNTVPKESDFGHVRDVETLVKEAAAPAVEWFAREGDPNTRGPRIFNETEIRAVQHFIDGYCYLNKWTRDDVCHRIWSNERKKDKFWESLTRVLPYRLRASIYKHVRRQYHVFEVRAKWTKEEDETLSRLAAETSGKWKRIGQLMQRMPEDCRDRWRNYVKCGSNRSLQKWTAEEEQTLKDIVNAMLCEDNKSVNWTVVSERMNGMRSRIQCRYKWSKLLKKESQELSERGTAAMRQWLVRKLQTLGYERDEDVEWDYLAHVYGEETKEKVSSKEMERAFAKIRTEVTGHKKMSLREIVAELASEWERPEDKKDDPASIANAAVAAIASGVAEPQEYSLWR